MGGLTPVEGFSPETLTVALRECESIASRKRSSLHDVSQFMRDRCRYEGFLAMYAVMRVIDDFVDAVPNPGAGAPAEQAFLEDELEGWRCRVEAAYAGEPGPGNLDLALSSALRSFPVPPTIWRSFLGSMVYDLRRNTIDTWEAFSRYAEGATVAPTTIFMYLLCAEPVTGPSSETDGGRPVRYELKDVGDGFDYRSCARDLGTFAYLAHILRDVREDLNMGREGRIYIPVSALAEAGFSLEQFRGCVTSGSTDARWRRLVDLVMRRARCFEKAGVSKARSRYSAMEPDCRLILTRIIATYRDLLNRIESAPESVLRNETVS